MDAVKVLAYGTRAYSVRAEIAVCSTLANHYATNDIDLLFVSKSDTAAANYAWSWGMRTGVNVVELDTHRQPLNAHDVIAREDVDVCFLFQDEENHCHETDALGLLCKTMNVPCYLVEFTSEY